MVGSYQFTRQDQAPTDPGSATIMFEYERTVLRKRCDMLKLPKMTSTTTAFPPPGLIFPTHAIVHTLCFLFHLLYPSLRQVVVFLLQLLLLLLRHVELERQSHHFILYILDKLALTPQLIDPVLASPLKIHPDFLKLNYLLLL
jgi:hypothetical protein